MDEITKARFWSKVAITSGNSKNVCWLWTSAMVNKRDRLHQYGRFDGKLAHRLSYEICKGPIPEDRIVRHMCHNPSCVNPHHLVVGTQQDNMDDMNNADRGVYLRGSKHANSLVNEQDVIDMRTQFANGVRPKDICKQYPLKIHAVRNILNRKTWKHV